MQAFVIYLLNITIQWNKQDYKKNCWEYDNGFGVITKIGVKGRQTFRWRLKLESWEDRGLDEGRSWSHGKTEV